MSGQGSRPGCFSYCKQLGVFVITPDAVDACLREPNNDAENLERN